jgi:hypothetical protein
MSDPSHPNGWSIRDVLAEIDKRNDERFTGSDRAWRDLLAEHEKRNDAAFQASYKFQDQRYLQQQTALDAAFIELQRRLTVLNHAHEAAQEKDKEYVREESWRLARVEDKSRIELISIGLNELRNIVADLKSGTTGSREAFHRTLAVGIFGAIATAITFIIVHH